MKKLIAIVLVSSLFVNIYAQDKYFIITGGIAQPKNDFSSNDINNLDAAFAMQGYNFSFEMAYYLNDFLGFGANLKFNRIGYDSEAYNTVSKERFIGQLDSINLNSGDYNLHNFLLGPYLKVTFLDRVTIYGKAFFGVMSSFRPNQLLVYSETTSLAINEIPVDGKFVGALALNLGAGIILKLTDRIGITVSADYVTSKPKFEKISLETLEVVEEKQLIVLNNYNAGIVLSF